MLILYLFLFFVLFFTNLFASIFLLPSLFDEILQLKAKRNKKVAVKEAMMK